MNITAKVNFIYENIRRAYPERRFMFQSAGSVYANTDEIKVLQIINNFVSNAIKFTPADKTITITISKEVKQVSISVSDEGVGIPEELKTELFVRKGSAGREGILHEPSHGYGLAISKKLADSLRGTIEVQSQEVRAPSLR